MRKPEYSPSLSLPEKRLVVYNRPGEGYHQDKDRIYKEGIIHLGAYSPLDVVIHYEADQKIRGVMGAQLGDEGKGRIVDNLTELVLEDPEIESVDVIRFNGGNNAGHTIENRGIKLALHQVPSSVMHEKATGIMDTGMAINVEDLRTEIDYVEDAVGDTRGKLLVSERTSLNTDLERAEELFNNERHSESRGGTKRGISPTFAHRYDRTGSTLRNLLSADWDVQFGERYDDYQKSFSAAGFDLATMVVPDFKAFVEQKTNVERTVGEKDVFLERLSEARAWLIDRGMTIDTITRHRQSAMDPSKAIILEGAQAVGLDPWVGTWPDTTSSNTTFYGVNSGTGFYTKEMIGQRMAIVKHNPSSVGERKMPTLIDLPRKSNNLPKNATPEQIYATKVRKVANERGTTTERWRDMNHLDLPFLTYNLIQGGANVLGVTHMDVAWENEPIKVCYEYENPDGNPTTYQPDLEYLKTVTPIYDELPGWDGEACAEATTIDEIPENARNFLALLQARTGIPVVVFTNGPRRDNIVELQGYRKIS